MNRFRLGLASAWQCVCAQLLAVQLRQSNRPRGSELAAAWTVLGLIADPSAPSFAGSALEALGRQASWRQRLAFAWSWRYRVNSHALEKLQADRFTQSWCVTHMSGPESLPAGGAVLLTVHHFNQYLGETRLSGMVERLGVVTLFKRAAGARVGDDLAGGSSRDEVLRLRIDRYQRIYGDRIYCPPNAARPGLRLLEQGGYLVIKPDFTGRPTRSHILGRQFSVGPGALWFARQSGRPIVPFGTVREGPGWRLWCGEPVAPDRANVERLVEDCIRASPASWMFWPQWFAAPRAPTPQHGPHG